MRELKLARPLISGPRKRGPEPDLGSVGLGPTFRAVWLRITVFAGIYFRSHHGDKKTESDGCYLIYPAVLFLRSTRVGCTHVSRRIACAGLHNTYTMTPPS
jgi:hypothetical protein